MTHNNNDNSIRTTSAPIAQNLVDGAFAFCLEHGLNSSLAVFVDYSIPSDRCRFFVYSFAYGRVVMQSLCAHGRGMGSTDSEPHFSNVEGSECSSLGRFVIVERRRMNTMPEDCLAVDGLDPTNDNALRRLILIHPYHVVDRYESGEAEGLIPVGPTSRGCFTISHRAMDRLLEIYEAQPCKRILVYAYV